MNTESLEKVSEKSRVVIFNHSTLNCLYFICSPYPASTFLIIHGKGREFFDFEKTTSAYLFQIGKERNE